MRRRDFITLLGSAAAIGPLAARAEQPTRRVGLLMSQNDPDGQARVRVFVDALQHLGWTDGRNVRLDIRWAAGRPADSDKYAAELVSLTPDVIFASASMNLAALQRVTPKVPIVFANVIDPVGAGAWRGRAATSPDLALSNTALAENGSNCSRSLRPMLRELASFAILR
jgi:putative tryptophan/tyrosine transport system substrate-binding protein